MSANTSVCHVECQDVGVRAFRVGLRCVVPGEATAPSMLLCQRGDEMYNYVKTVHRQHRTVGGACLRGADGDSKQDEVAGKGTLNCPRAQRFNLVSQAPERSGDTAQLLNCANKVPRICHPLPFLTGALHGLWNRSQLKWPCLAAYMIMLSIKD